MYTCREAVHSLLLDVNKYALNPPHDYITITPLACTEIDGSGELVPDSTCLNSSVPNANPSSVELPVSSQQASGMLLITVGTVCAAVALVLLMVICVVMWILIKKHQQKQKEKSEPPSPVRYKW